MSQNDPKTTSLTKNPHPPTKKFFNGRCIGIGPKKAMSFDLYSKLHGVCNSESLQKEFYTSIFVLKKFSIN